MYEARFDLAKRPFGAAPQAVDYYPSRSMEAARQGLLRGIDANAGPGIVVSAAGMGKTTLCLKLEQQCRERLPTAFLSCCGLQSRRELLQNILFAFGQPYEGKDEGELRISLTHFVRSSDQQKIVLIVDDVDDVPVELFEELRSLGNMIHNGVWCVNLLLAGKTKLEERLGLPSMESFEQRISSRNYLASWNSRETADFVEFEIKRCGGDASSIFSSAAIEQIYVATGGVPRLVNQLCDQALIMAALGNVAQLRAEHVEEAWSDLQQLPPPQRATTTGPSTSDSMIEFGTLDEPSCQHLCATDEAGPPAGPYVEPEYDDPPLRAEQDDAATAASQASDDPPDFDFVAVDGSPSPAEVPGHPPEAEVGQFSTCKDPATDPNSKDLVDRLDDIEREVQRCSNELDGQVDDESLEQACDSTYNPFLEVFDEEELVFATHNTLNNELVHRQPTVVTAGGESLINVMRMVNHSASPNSPWERLDDVTTPQSAEPGLALELTPLRHHLPEVGHANEECCEFGDGDFRFQKAAPSEPTSPVQPLETAPVEPAGCAETKGPEPTVSDGSDDRSAVVICSATESNTIEGSDTADSSRTQSNSGWALNLVGENPRRASVSHSRADEILAVVQRSEEPSAVSDIHFASQLGTPGLVSENNFRSLAAADPVNSIASPPVAPNMPSAEPPQGNAEDRPSRGRFNKLFSNLKPANS